MSSVAPRARRRGAGWACTVVGALTLWTLACGGGYVLSAWAARALRPAKTRLVHSHVSVLRLHRSGLDRASEVWIYRPQVRGSADLPVVYYLHGQPGLPVDIFRAGLKRAMDAYIGRGGAPFVIAAPDASSSRHIDTEWGDASDGSDSVESFIVQSVIPTVEGSHPRTKMRRAIAGFSMGGFGAVNIALHHPDLFGQIVSLAGYYRPDDPSEMFATVEATLANDPTANSAQARGKRVLLVEDRGETLPMVRGQSGPFARLLDSAGAAAVAREAPGGHDLAFVISELPAVAGFLARGFGAAPGA